VNVVWAKVAAARAYAGQTVSIAVSETIWRSSPDDQEASMAGRATTKPIRNIKADRP
jgi:hypothetical protein